MSMSSTHAAWWQCRGLGIVSKFVLPTIDSMLMYTI
jgi:hypothetical protein